VRLACMTLWLPLIASAQPLPAALEARLNTHDVPGVLELFAEDGKVELVQDPDRQRLPSEVWVGRKNLELFSSIQTRGLTIRFADISAAADHGSWSVELRNDYFRSLGLDVFKGRAVVEWVGLHIIKLSIVGATAQSDVLAAAVPRANKAAVQRLFDDINQGDMSGLERQLSANYVQHSSMPVSPGRSGVRQVYAQLRASFPDLRITVEDLVAEGDRVAARVTWRGTQKGEYLGVQPTGRAILVSKMDFCRFESGVMVEHWDVVDRLSLLQQLGVVPRFPQWNPSLGYDGFR
jgi:predicted ester cyclase